MPRYVTSQGRSRSARERLMTRALMFELDVERTRRGMDQRHFAELLGVHEALLSLYRSGNRLPSLPSILEMDQKIPGFFGRIAHRYYAMSREQGSPSSGPETAEDDIAISLFGAVTGRELRELSIR
jgi:transcriptional regulator with XRE-family HTH domain